MFNARLEDSDQRRLYNRVSNFASLVGLIIQALNSDKTPIIIVSKEWNLLDSPTVTLSFWLLSYLNNWNQRIWVFFASIIICISYFRIWHQININIGIKSCNSICTSMTRSFVLPMLQWLQSLSHIGCQLRLYHPFGGNMNQDDGFSRGIIIQLGVVSSEQQYHHIIDILNTIEILITHKA